MSKCTVKMSVDICGESALDAVTNLVVNEQMQVKAACIKVSEEFNSSNDGATVKWETLRKSYQRANKSVGHVPQKKKAPKKPEIPMAPVDAKETIDTFATDAKIGALEAEIVKLKADNEIIVNTMLEQEAEILALKQQLKGGPPKNAPSQPKPNTVPEEYDMPRSEAFSIIKERGNQYQVLALTTDNLTNDKLLLFIKKIGQDMLQNTPPHMMPKHILNITNVV